MACSARRFPTQPSISAKWVIGCLLALLPLLAPAQARRPKPAAGKASKTAAKQPVDYVNVFTGTSNSRWALFPEPTVPFGMAKLSLNN